MKWTGPSGLDPLLKAIVWGEERDAFDSELGKSLLRAYSVGACDDELAGMIHDLVRPLRVKEARGTLVPFRRPRLGKGEIALGRDPQGVEVRLPLRSLTAGLLLAANTGAGKTNFLMWLLLQIAEAGCRVWVSDMYKTQLRHMLPSFRAFGQHLVVLRPADWRLNLLQSAGDPRAHLGITVDLLVRTLALPPRSRVILSQGCHALYRQFAIAEGQTDGYPCLFDLYEWVRTTRGLNAAAREAILDRLGAVLVALTPATAAYRRAWTPQDLAAHSICFEMRGTSETVKQLLLEPALYSVMRAEVDRGAVNTAINLFVAFEDSQRFFASQQHAAGDITPMDELAGIIRGSGKGLGVIVQTLEGVSSRLLPNLATKIMGRMGSHKDYSRLGADLAMNRQQVEWARRHLRPGRYVLQAADRRWREPCLVEVPRLKLPETVSDVVARRSTEPLRNLPCAPATRFKNWEPHHLLHVGGAAATSERPQGSVPTERKSDIPPAKAPKHPLPKLNKERLDYLAAIAQQPTLTVTERDRELHLGASKAQRIRRELTDLGLVRVVTVNAGGRGGASKLLELTVRARRILDDYGVESATGLGRGGIKSQYYCAVLARTSQELGVDAVIEDERSGARVDVALSVGVSRIALEVEISPGHEITNVEKDLAAGFDRVLTFVETETDLLRVEQKLARLPNEERSKSRVVLLKEHADVLREELRRREPPEPGLRKESPSPRISDASGQPRSEGPPRDAEVWVIDDVASYLQIPKSSIYKMTARRAKTPIPHSKVGGKLRFRKAEIDEWLRVLNVSSLDALRKAKRRGSGG